jgi:hypothetical protein
MLTVATDKYRKNGVMVYSGSDRVRVIYNGLLPQSGAAHVYAHIGFDENWTAKTDVPMLRTSCGFEATVPVQGGDVLQIAFKDCANHWDNNSGNNYNF